MQVSGLSYTIDIGRKYDVGKLYRDRWYKGRSVSRVMITEVHGKPFDESAIYAVITNNIQFTPDVLPSDIKGEGQDTPSGGPVGEGTSGEDPDVEKAAAETVAGEEADKTGTDHVTIFKASSNDSCN